MNNLKILQISDAINKIQRDVLYIYEENNLLDEKNDLVDNLKMIEQDEDIIITFIGQYSAGKSTIVSALTGNRNIKIDANIATETATRYKWSDQITLVDTPGLYTENLHHNLATKKAIEKSNMLVYCITNELFDEITIEDYKNWAYELQYKDKMFLVINKMSRETGQFEDLVVNYKESMNKALEPHNLEDVRYNFIDAKDYLEGIDLNFKELIELSRFEDFIFNLNEFASENGLLSKLDTPIKAIINSIDLVLSSSLEKESDKNFIQLFDRIYKRIDFTINRIEKKSKFIVKQNLNTFVSYGYNIAQNIGREDFVFNELEFKQKLEEVGILINDEINQLLESENKELEEEIGEVFDSELGKIYIKNISKEPEYQELDLTSKDNTSNFLKLADFVNKSKADNIILSQGVSFLAKSSEVAGGTLHKGVKAIGKTIGFKFKPWQAVNIAKQLGKFVSGIGVVASILSVFSSMKEVDKEERQFNKLMKQKQEMRTTVMDIAKDLEKEYSIQIQKITKEYEKILNEINTLKEDKLKEVDRNNDMNQKLKIQKEKLKKLQKSIFEDA